MCTVPRPMVAATARSLSRTASMAGPRKDREEQSTLSEASLVETAARLLEVSTSPGTSLENLRGPCGMLMSTSRARVVLSSSAGRVSPSEAVSSSATREADGSLGYSLRMSSADALAASSAAGSASRGTASTMRASRGMALCLSPPLMVTRRTPGPAEFMARRAVAARRQRALARPSWMLMPLWPPMSPSTRTSTSAASGPTGAASRASGMSIEMSPPPAHPM
mmetsp:Transcript_27153/g.90867  ORF Transcript_27153/g.90867 Transcript_27153/m.90867 type:complete len:223 (-) Transcript_27153:615-1283(-)